MMINDPTLDISNTPAAATLFAKMANIMAEVDDVEKDGYNAFHKYNYASASAVASEIRKQMGKNKIAFLPETIEVKDHEGRWLVVYRYTFACGDTGATYSCRWEGEAQNTNKGGGPDDKALAKAATTAQKYFLLKTFNISTDDDPDTDKQGNHPRVKKKSGSSSNSKPATTTQPAPEAPAVLWPSRNTVDSVMDAFRGDMDLSNGEILKLAGVTAIDDGDGWRRYATPQAAVKAIQAAFDNATAGQSNEPMTATFNFMSYVGKGGTLLFATSDPTKGDHTIATLWGGRGAIKSMYGNDELHEQLELSQYDAIKDKQAFSDWKKMIIAVDFEFVSERSNNRDEDYFKIVGIAGDPVIPF